MKHENRSRMRGPWRRSRPGQRPGRRRPFGRWLRCGGCLPGGGRSRRGGRSRLGVLLWVGGCLGLGGCDIPPRPTPISVEPRVAGARPPQADHGPEASDTADPERQASWESWAILVRAGRPLGYRRVSVAPSLDQAVVLRYEIDQRIVDADNDALISRHTRTRYSERFDVGLERFRSETWQGHWHEEVRGEPDGDVYHLESVRGLRPSAARLAEPPPRAGPLAVERSLRARPPQPGETRKLRVVDPASGTVTDVRLHCAGEAMVPRIDGERERLLEVNRTDLADGDVVAESVMWVDAEGIPRRWLVPELAAVAYAASPAEVAFHAEAGGWGEVGDASRPIATVAIRGQMPDAARSRLTLYEVAIEDPTDDVSLSDMFARGPDQHVRPIDERQVQVLINRLNRRRAKGFRSAAGPSTAEDLARSRLIDFGSKEVQDLARRAGRRSAGGLDDDGQAALAVELAKLTHGLTSLETTGQGLVPASDVIRRARGDALGQAVLLAALLRAKQIPARVVLGLRYVDDQGPLNDQGLRGHGAGNRSDDPHARFDREPEETGQGIASSGHRMELHFWTAAWYGDRWNGLDATVGSGTLADRITMQWFDLASGSEQQLREAYLESLRQLPSLRIRLLRVVEEEASAQPVGTSVPRTSVPHPTNAHAALRLTRSVPRS